MTKKTIEALKKLQKERLDLGLRKSRDYSGKIDNIGLTGIEGISIRIFDKACRLLNLAKNPKKRLVKDETLIDTLKDLANYADYGVLLLRNQWEV